MVRVKGEHALALGAGAVAAYAVLSRRTGAVELPGASSIVERTSETIREVAAPAVDLSGVLALIQGQQQQITGLIQQAAAVAPRAMRYGNQGQPVGFDPPAGTGPILTNEHIGLPPATAFGVIDGTETSDPPGGGKGGVPDGVLGGFKDAAAGVFDRFLHTASRDDLLAAAKDSTRTTLQQALRIDEAVNGVLAVGDTPLVGAVTGFARDARERSQALTDKLSDALRGAPARSSAVNDAFRAKFSPDIHVIDVKVTDPPSTFGSHASALGRGIQSGSDFIYDNTYGRVDDAFRWFFRPR